MRYTSNNKRLIKFPTTRQNATLFDRLPGIMCTESVKGQMGDRRSRRVRNGYWGRMYRVHRMHRRSGHVHRGRHMHGRDGVIGDTYIRLSHTGERGIDAFVVSGDLAQISRGPQDIRRDGSNRRRVAPRRVRVIWIRNISSLVDS